MATSPLLLQIASRTAAFLQNTGVSQARLCRHLNVSDSSHSQFLHGTKSLDPSVIIKLCQTLNLSHREVAEKFSEPVRTAKLMHLQESVLGQPAQMRMDDSGGSWTPGLVGVDPAIGGTIVDPPDDGPTDADLNCLRQVRKIHRQAIRLINSFINTAKQARVNRGDGTTAPTNQRFAR